MSQREVMASVLLLKSAIVECVRAELRAAPSASGTLVMHWRIDASGSVGDVCAWKSTPDEEPLGRCLRGVLAGLHFEQRPNGWDILFPFKFGQSYSANFL